MAEVSLLCRSDGIAGSSDLASSEGWSPRIPLFFPGAGTELVKLVLSPDPPLSSHDIAAMAKIPPAFCPGTRGPISLLAARECNLHAPT